MDWLLSDEELARIDDEVYNQITCDIMPVLRAVAEEQHEKDKAGFKKWGEELCDSAIHGFLNSPRRYCKHCWQSLTVPQSVDHIADTGKKVVPTIDEMSGLVEDFTDGKPLKDYMDDLRGKVEG